MGVSNPNDIATQRVITLSTTSQGKGRLYRMEKVDTKNAGKTETVNEVGNDLAAGFIRKPGGETVTADFYEQKGKPWPDWDALIESQEPVVVTDQIIGGQRRQYGPARVSSADRSGDKDGGHKVNVELVALGKKTIK